MSSLEEKIAGKLPVQAYETLRTYFGYNSFRRGQEDLIAGILEQRDVLGVMPTGAGKSVCYQVPAALLEGITLVISPLISLMKDQVDTLNQAGLPTAFLNSTLTAAELNERFREIANGAYKVVYVAPERLESERFLRLLQELRIPLVAVDEAHCVSQWGHDFRPSYLAISRVIDAISPRPVIAAFTATATDQVKEDIIHNLRMDEPIRVTTGYARENLSFSVVKGIDKKAFLQEYLAKQTGQAGIIYAPTRKDVEELHHQLERWGVRAGRYHAGLADEERARNQELFLYDDIQVMVATNAFGMGIDKSNVRFVIHYSMPKNLESYYQEAGRAGRDGEPGECILLFGAQDVMLQKFLIGQGEGDEARKTMDYGNLHDMVEYCHTTDCLQQVMVRYFGDPFGEPCGRCSSCTDERELQDITVEAQKIFSCVARMRQRFGVTLTAKVLRGASDAKVRQFGFDSLPTYGALSSLKEKDIAGLMHVLAADGYLAMSDSAFPTVSLTEKARRVLAGEEQVLRKVTVSRPGSSKSRGSSRGSDGEAGMEGREELFDQLRQLRKTFAERERVPPFTIFHDASLREMCAHLPQTAAAFLDIKGVGQNKFAKYGDAFLTCIRDYAERTGQ